MNISFGIVTACENKDHLNAVINNIRNLKIPNYEIILVGEQRKISECVSGGQDLVIIDFNENSKSMWITRKKNLITHQAKYDNIVYSHDYVIYNDDFYSGFLQFGENFHACMVKVYNADGTRFRDWVIYPDDASQSVRNFAGITSNELMLPYEEARMSKYQYFSGSWWMAKKNVMMEIPLDESLAWGQGEDLIWSRRFRDRYSFSMNSNSSVKFLKKKVDAFEPMRPECYVKAAQYVESVLRGERAW